MNIAQIHSTSALDKTVAMGFSYEKKIK